MPLLWNSQTSKMENAPEGDVTNGVASGRFSFRKGVRIPVVGPDGQEGTIASEDSGTAFQNGWRYQTSEEVKAKTEAGIEAGRAEAYDAPVTAFAAGALRGATIGLSDVALHVALRASGADKEALSQVRERSPIASIAGEITGGIAGMATPWSPVSALAKGGAAVTKATMGAIGATTKAGKIVAELGSHAAGSAVEGAAYGTGILLTEAALGDPELTASQVASTVGISTLMGAGLGVVGKGVSQAWNKWKSTASNPVALMSEGYGKATAKLFGLKGQAENDFVSVFERSSAPERAEIAHYAVNRDELYQRGLSAVQRLEEAGKYGATVTDDVRKGAMSKVAGEALPTYQIPRSAQETYIEPVMKEVETGFKRPPGAVPAAVQTEMQAVPEAVVRTKEWTETLKDTRATQSITKKMERVAKEIEGSQKYKAPVAADIRQTMQDYSDAIATAETKGDVFQATWRARKELDGFAEPFRKGDLSYEAQNTLGKITEVRNTLQEHLRDQKVYGSLAKTFEEGDSIFKNYLAAKDNFKDQFMASKYVAGEGRKKELSPGKVKRFWQNPEAESMAFKKETLTELENSVGKMQAYAEKNGDVFGIDIGAISDELRALERLRVSELAISGVESFTGKSLSGAVAGAALGGLGSLVSEDIGAGTTTALALTGLAAANPRMAVKYLAKMERLQNEFGARADNALTSILSIPRKGKLATVEAGGVARRETLMEMAHMLAPPDKKPTKHDDALDSLAPYIMDPSKVDDRLVESNPHLDGAAPATYAAMVNQSHAAMAFMRDKWPQKGNADAIFATPGQLSESERHTLEAYALGAFSPGSLLDQLKSGKIDPKTIEAVKAVHPTMFEDVKRRMVEMIPDAKNIPYKKKMALGAAFGIPTTSGLANVGIIQQALNAAPQDAPGQPGVADLTGMAQSMRTPSMNVAMR